MRKRKSLIYYLLNFIYFWIRRLTRSYASSYRIDAHISESEAGKQFLETLQRNRQDDELIELPLGTSAEVAASIVNSKAKRNSLRSSLENMLVEFLREVSPDSTEKLIDDRPLARNRRNARQSDYDEDPGNRSGEAEEGDEIDMETMRKIEIGSRNVTVEPYFYKPIRKPRDCDAVRRKISQLDQYELDKSLTQSDEAQLNIRKVLNYR